VRGTCNTVFLTTDFQTEQSLEVEGRHCGKLATVCMWMKAQQQGGNGRSDAERLFERGLLRGV